MSQAVSPLCEIHPEREYALAEDAAPRRRASHVSQITSEQISGYCLRRALDSVSTRFCREISSPLKDSGKRDRSGLSGQLRELASFVQAVTVVRHDA